MRSALGTEAGKPRYAIGKPKRGTCGTLRILAPAPSIQLSQSDRTTLRRGSLAAVVDVCLNASFSPRQSRVGQGSCNLEAVASCTSVMVWWCTANHQQTGARALELRRWNVAVFRKGQCRADSQKVASQLHKTGFLKYCLVVGC